MALKCVTNDGYEKAALTQSKAIVNQAIADSAIQAGIALWQRNSSSSIAKMQRDIAHQQMVLAEEIHEHAKIFWPEETDLVNDAFAVGKVETQYVGLAGAWTGLVDDAEATGRALWLEVSRQLCYAPDRCDDARWQRNEQSLRADMIGYAARQDEARTETLNDERYARQVAVLGLGRGKVPALVTYQGIAGVNGALAAQFIEGSIDSALTAYGYTPARGTLTTGWAQGIRQLWADVKPVPVTQGIGANTPATEPVQTKPWWADSTPAATSSWLTAPPPPPLPIESAPAEQGQSRREADRPDWRGPRGVF